MAQISVEIIRLSGSLLRGNLQHIVLMRPIRSMIEFKQIIGRGTRTFDGKDFFTIWDFVKAHENFSDPDWDGEPLAPEPPGDPRTPPTGPEPGGEPPEPGGEDPTDPPREKIVVKLSDGKARRIAYAATTTYWSADGKPISATQFLERLLGDLSGLIANEDQLRSVWSNPDNREKLLGQLSDRGYDQDRLDDIRRLVDAPDSDLFDVLSYVLYTREPMRRSERAEYVRGKNSEIENTDLREFLMSILKAYEENGESELATRKLGQFINAKFGRVSESKARLGDLSTVKSAYSNMQADLYSR
nr:type I restriction-modification enzyme R subunit C-terminal domain-containing protein [Pararhodobacter sp.]